MSDLPIPLDIRLRALADEAAADAGLFVLDAVVRGRPGAQVVEVFVESETGAGADDLAALSRSLGFLIETEGLISGAYRLDVSTPGADRPLTDPRQFRRHIGKPLAVRYADGDGESAVDAPLTAADDDGITLGEGDAAVTVPYPNLREARVRLPW